MKTALWICAVLIVVFLLVYLFCSRYTLLAVGCIALLVFGLYHLLIWVAEHGE